MESVSKHLPNDIINEDLARHTIDLARHSKWEPLGRQLLAFHSTGDIFRFYIITFTYNFADHKFTITCRSKLEIIGVIYL